MRQENAPREKTVNELCVKINVLGQASKANVVEIHGLKNEVLLKY